MKFGGFPRNVRVTPVPDPLFNVLLEQIEDVVELKVTLRAIWLLGQKRVAFRTLGEDELLYDSTLVKSVRDVGNDPQQLIERALEMAVNRGTLLRYSGRESGGNTVYLVNTYKGRSDLGRLKAGQLSPENSEIHGTLLSDISDGGTEISENLRPNIFALYEDNIGTIGPAMAEKLKEAEERYPVLWISDAFSVAIRENKLNWGYISAILRRWAAEGRSGGRDVRGTTPRGNEGRNYGESGRYTPPNSRSRYTRRQRR